MQVERRAFPPFAPPEAAKNWFDKIAKLLDAALPHFQVPFHGTILAKRKNKCNYLT